ncbi:hypothetical protein ACGFNU_11460 [Spirillospora sp. NPDC048911]|uniref:hypothetical protein n=1 Tax=Spirillospora sp. NPDC048911 TaxID=3364527 RepID=UPI00372061A0
MRRISKRLTSTVVRSAVAGAVVTGTVMAMAPAASASHKCDRSQEICYWRLSGYTGGSRAFTNEDYTYTNDYYDNLSPTKNINNSISSLVNYHSSRFYRLCRYVEQSYCLFSIEPQVARPNLADYVWPGSASLDNSISSHTVY